jgi:predicted ATP-grasp superfamily ATP-dependent carboligase
LLERLFEIRRSIGSRPILLTASDSAALFVSEQADILRDSFIFRSPPAELVRTLCSKRLMWSLASSLGIPCPASWFPTCLAHVEQISRDAEFPLLMKSVEAGAANDVCGKIVVSSRSELLAAWEAWNSLHTAVMIQEFIEGSDRDTWMFNGYFDEHGSCLFGMTGRKIRQYRAYAGVTSLGECEENLEVLDMTLRLMRSIGYQGIVDMGYRYDRRDGKYKVFDINPRMGCSFRLFVSDTGMDVVRAMYLDATNQPVEPGRPVPGRKWLVEDIDVAAGFCYWRDGSNRVLEWLRSYWGVTETAFLAFDDMLPFAAMWANDFGALVGKGQGGRVIPTARLPVCDRGSR